MVGNIEVVGALKPCALMHSWYDLKAAQINSQSRLIRKDMLNDLGVGSKSQKQPKTFAVGKLKGQLMMGP